MPMQKLTFVPFAQLNPIWDEVAIQKILNLLNTKHSTYLNEEIFDIEAGFTKEQIQIKFSLRKNDNSVVYPIEVICIYDDYPNLKRQDICHIIIDYLDSYWSEYFMEERNVFVSIDWGRHECEGVVFFLRGFVRNLNLEKQADLYLKEHGHGQYEIHSISSES